MRHMFGVAVVMTSTLAMLGGCTEGEDPAPSRVVDAVQEDSVNGDEDVGSGLMWPSSLDLPDQGLSAGDLDVMIRSFEPDACDMFESADPLADHGGFSWSVYVRLPVDRLEAGQRFDFADAGQPNTEDSWLLAGIESRSEVPEASGVTSIGGSSGDCDGDFYVDEEPSHLVIVERDETSMTIDIDNLCVDEFEDEWDAEPTIHRLDGRYRIELCPAPNGT